MNSLLKNVKIGTTNSNRNCGWRGSRISIYNSSGDVVGRFVIPAKFGALNYLKNRKDFSTGTYLHRFHNALCDAVGAGITHVDTLEYLQSK